jgi:hypothetical protein
MGTLSGCDLVLPAETGGQDVAVPGGVPNPEADLMMLCPMQCGEQSGRGYLPWCPLVPDVLDCRGVVCD